MDPLFDLYSVRSAEPGHRLRAGKTGSSGTSRDGLHPDDDGHPDCRKRFHYVAGRADYRTRHWQWNVAADFCRHCRRIAARHRGPLAKVPDMGSVRLWNPAPAGCVHDCGGGLHRLHGAFRAAHSRAVRQARGGPAHHGWAIHTSAAKGQFRWRHARNLCLVAVECSADAGPLAETSRLQVRAAGAAIELR